MNPNELGRLIDHTLLRPGAGAWEASALCSEAMTHGFYAVCLQPSYVRIAREMLAGSAVKTAAVIDFPLGHSTTESRVYAAMDASLNGAEELDIVISLPLIKSGRWDEAVKDLRAIVMATPGVFHKVIIETCYLDDSEKKRAVEAVIQSGAEMVKTSTGFGPYGAKVSDIRLIKSIASGAIGIKASGGIKTREDAIAMIEAGATRIGTSSGIAIIGG